jgi:energy-coupling factor transporter ATP-binding protein EcfA2
MDFYKIKERSVKNGVIEVYPDFIVCRSKDLMVRGRSFYAIWDEEKNLWSTDEYDVQRLIDIELYKYAEEVKARNQGVVQVKTLGDFSTNSWMQFRNYVGHISDSSHQLDEKLTFANTEVRKTDYVSRKLQYPLQPGSRSSYDELVSVLYDPSERQKLEWAVGSIVAGDSKHIQKFVVLYGSAGAGKSTYLNIIQKLFSGYYTTFEAKSITSNTNSFSTEVFKSNPLVAIQHDGDLSRIEDNTKLNSIVSHEEMTMNEKYKPSYTSRINAFLFMGTNKPVKITDAKSGIIRRLIDVKPSGQRVSAKKYQTLMSQIDFELGAIAHHCLEVYRELGKDYYISYRPTDMILETDVFYNFIEDNFDIFKEQNGVTLNQAYEMYKVFCDASSLEYKMPRYKFREEIKNYFHNFEERAIVDGVRVRSWYSGFITDHLKIQAKEETPSPLILDNFESIFDTDCMNQPAQYANEQETPIKKWSDVTTRLSDIDTTKLHYVKPPLNHIVIDFDLKDDSGEKSLELNIEAASKWPKTYAELSKGGSGIHLHYIYDGDPTLLNRVYSEGIEIKVFTGDSSLRRKLSKCNNIEVSTINSGLPLKEKKMVNVEGLKSEKSIRDLINRNINKEIHPGTKPSMDFIYKILEDAYKSELQYDVSDLKPKLLAFANNSSNQADYCIKLLQKMKFKSEEKELVADIQKDERLVFFDVEVFPNLFIICWKYEDTDTVVRMINPSPQEVEELFKFKLVGFNCRRYDNHILYARYMGYTNEQLYNLSQKIIGNSTSALFGEAYNISYTDIYDYSSKKQGLKKFQIELGLHHKELNFPWDKPVPEDKWTLVAEYCDNDVISTEAVHKARIQDFVARQILSKLSGLPVNSTTQQHTARIVFGKEKNPQDVFVYTDLSEMFPGYKYEAGSSTYRGETTGEGGYVYAEPGMYTNVAVLDVASMHPTSIEQLDMFGPYTKNFSALKAARIAIKRKDFDTAKTMLNGILTPYLTNPDDAEALSYALKIIINIVYGLTSAKFPNAFNDPRNIDNIVAKRGALFMIDLKNFVQENGYQAVHIKTDSIKIPNADKKIIDLVMEFGNNYGYEFEHEVTYDKFCLVNDAVYIAKTLDGKKPSYWDAVGAQFQHPYVFKKLFSREPIEFRDLCETKTVTTALYLDFNGVETPMALTDPMHFVGRAGLFCPIQEGKGGGLLMREKDGKFYAAVGTKGYRWLESEMVEVFNKKEDINMQYFDSLVNDAIENISKYGDFEWFTD